MKTNTSIRKPMSRPLVKQFAGESKPRFLYIATRSGGAETLCGYAFNAMLFFQQTGFSLCHEIVAQDGDTVTSTSGGQTFHIHRVGA